MNPGDIIVTKPGYAYADLYDEEGWKVSLDHSRRHRLLMLCLDAQVNWGSRGLKQTLVMVLVEGMILYVSKVCCESLK